MKSWKIALVLSGGAAKGASQAGFLKALFESVPVENVVAVSASSIGILNGYAIVSGQLNKMCEIWRDFHAKNIFQLYRFERKYVISERLLSALVAGGEPRVPIYFSACKLPDFSVCYFDAAEFSSAERVEALKRGLAFPFLVKMRKGKEGRYLDGGLLDNVPVLPIQETDADLLIVLHTDPKYRTPAALYQSDRAVVDFVVNLGECEKNDHFDFRHPHLERSFLAAYEYGSECAKQLFYGAEDRETLRENAFELYRAELEKRKKKHSVDTIATRYNNLFWNLAELFR